jgi:hypothetical protein
MKIKWLFLVACLVLNVAHAATPEPAMRYQLLDGSFLMDDCLICGRPSFNIPMRGSFYLRRIAVGPLATDYAIENATFKAADYSFTGSGTYRLGGDFVLTQTVTLSGDLQTAAETRKAAFTNETSTLSRHVPMFFATLKQTNGTLVSTITLTIAAAPLQEIWFSTATNFTRAIKLDNTVSDGDLLSTAGRIVKRNSDFQAHFPGPTFLNMGLDAVDVLPGEGIIFSSGTKGVLSDGDFAFERTGDIMHWQDFMNIVADIPGDPGLDGLHVESANKIYFSTKEDLNGFVGLIGNGDIVLVETTAPSGEIFRSNAALLNRFHPDEVKDYGLDAFYIWPNGEIWFSTATNFNDAQLGPISGGDLLSDAGYIVYRNADLTAALLPLGDPPTDFGLDAMVVVSDFTGVDGDATIMAAIDRTTGLVTLSWKGAGREFQVERATEVAGPWEPASPVIADLSYKDPQSITASSRAFYRVRQW